MNTKIDKIIANTKAHIDPLCLAFPIVMTVLGVVFVSTVGKTTRMAVFDKYLLFGFTLALLASIIVRTLKHGLALVSAIFMFVLVVAALFLLRFVVGGNDPATAFIAKYVIYIVPVLIAFNWIETFIP